MRLPPPCQFAPKGQRARNESIFNSLIYIDIFQPTVSICTERTITPNAVGGVRIGEPAADLAVLLAIQSSLRSMPLPVGLVSFGEIGLAGEIRPAPRGQDRLHEAAKLGFSTAVVPAANMPRKAIAGVKVHPVQRIDEALNLIRSL